MSTAQELFWRADSLGHTREAAKLYESAACDWRKRGLYFSAGYGMVRAAFSILSHDEKQATKYADAACQDYVNCIKMDPPDSFKSLLGLYKILNPIIQTAPIRRATNIICGELAHRLFKYYKSDLNAEGYLVKGFVIRTDLEDEWEPSFPTTGATSNIESWGSSKISFGCTSAFKLFLQAGDWSGAQAIINLKPDWFKTPTLRGWKAGIVGFLNPTQRLESFTDAANAFAEGDKRTISKTDEGETCINITKDWRLSSYFRARSLVEQARQEPIKTNELIIDAAKIVEEPGIGFYVDNVIWPFRILIISLANLLGHTTKLDMNGAKEQFSMITGTGLLNERLQTLIHQYLTNAAQAVEGFKTNPAREITSGRLSAALDALDRIPIIGPEVSHQLKPEIGANVWNLALGQVQTWIHRTLEKISDEGTLRQIILRLLQARIPSYAQIRHGPVEYGKDVVVLVEENGQKVLQMYQVKTGDITKANWNIVKNQLEEMFQIPISTFQLPTEPDHCEGVLICNGHANPFVEPVMDAWFKEQKADHDRDFSFQHLDNIVEWINKDRLINEFKKVLDDLGIKLVV